MQNSAIINSIDLIESAKEVFDIEANSVLELKNRLNDDFIKAIDIIYASKGKVVVTGMGKSGHIGKKIAATLASVGTPAFFVHPAEASHGDLGMLTTEDTILALSNSGESKELADIIAFAHRFGIKMICMVGNANSTLAKASDIILCYPPFEEACSFGMAPTTSTTLSLALGDALAMTLLELKGFTKELYRDRHPGGKLGAMLLKVKELMAKGSDMPVVSEGTTMTQALIEMTGKSLGCVGVIDANGRLIGMITDGDLRRHMSPSLLSLTVDEVMTKSPKTINGEMLAAEAVRFMNEKKITNVFAVDTDGKPEGLLHIHQCMQAGVV